MVLLTVIRHVTEHIGLTCCLGRLPRIIGAMGNAQNVYKYVTKGVSGTTGLVTTAPAAPGARFCRRRWWAARPGR